MVKLKEKNDFTGKYGPTAFQDHVVKAKKAYEKGDYIEAFVFLHTILEAYLRIVWAEFIFLFSNKKVLSVYDVKDWNFSDCVELLNEVNLITKDQSSVFLNFKKGRDKTVHELTHPMKMGKLNKKTFDGQFQAGLKSFEIVYNLTQEIAQVTMGKKTIQQLLKTNSAES